MARQQKKRPMDRDPSDAFTRFQKFTLALVKVPKEELDRRRAEYERQERERPAKSS